MSRDLDSQNVVHYLRKNARKTPERTALVEPTESGAESWSFAELEARADWMAAGLRAEGVRAGDRIIVMVPMSLKLYQVLLGVLELGAVAVFVDPWVGARQIASFATYAEPEGFVGVGKSHVVRLFESTLRTLEITVTTGVRIWRIPARRTWSEVLRYAGPVRLYPSEADDTALITFTSGSSGMPKGADRTHRFLSAQHEALNAEFPYGEDDVDMPTFPVFSLNNLANGVPTVIPDMDFRRVADTDGGRILDQIEAHSVTTATASPPFFDRLSDALESRGATGVPLRRILTGGAPVSDEQLRRWQRLMPDTEVVVIYGSTEAEPVAHIGAAERLEATSTAGEGSRGFCVGAPIDAVDARVIPISHKPVVLDEGWSSLELDTGDIGELVVCGDHVCERYFRNPEATAENKIVEDDGTVWHRMGDTGYFDDHGHFWLTGRVHSTIIRDGEPIQAQLVEQSARGDDPRIARLAAVGVPHQQFGSQLVLVVQIVNGEREESVIEDLSRRIERRGIAVDAIVVSDGEIPVDPRHNSKIDYAALRDQIGAVEKDSIQRLDKSSAVRR